MVKLRPRHWTPYFAASVLAVLLGCRAHQQVIPDPMQAHELAESCRCRIWVNMGADSAIKTDFDLEAGDACVSRFLVEQERQRRREEQQKPPEAGPPK